MFLLHVLTPMTLALASRMPAPPAICVSSAAPPAKGVHLFVEVVKRAPRDSVTTARLCLTPPRAGVGSYTATLTFDSTLMRAIRVSVSGGVQVSNTDVPGTIRLAGAAPTGFARGPLATILFKPRRGTTLAKVKVMLLEANTPAGEPVLSGSRVLGYPATDKTLGVVGVALVKANGEGVPRLPVSAVISALPRVDSISPRSGKVDAEELTNLVLYGSGFAESGNTVFFGGASIEGLKSEERGTIIRFIAPTWIPAQGKADGHRVQPGPLDVRVRSGAKTSNTVKFTVRGEER